MADGLNKVLLFGNLGQDPELRMTPQGQAVLRLRLATSKTYLDASRVKQERTEWHSVIVWGKRAEGLSRILSKGSKLLIEGELRTSSWEDNDGNKRFRTEIVASNVCLGGGGSRGGSSSSSSSDDYSGGYDQPDTLDDIPF